MRQSVEHLDIFPRYGLQTARRQVPGRWLSRFIPRHTVLPFREELYAWRTRLNRKRVRKRYAGACDLLVNLGAGKEGHAGWVNVDLYPYAGINCVFDCRKELPFPDGSVRAIFCEHFFEHIDYTEEVPFFLSECRRVLKDGGVIRIIVPDAGAYLHAYCVEGWDALRRLRPMTSDRTDLIFEHTYHTKMELINLVFRQGYEHKFAYDYETIEFLLYRYGFSCVQRMEFGRSRLPELAIDLVDRATESLYVEAIKHSTDRG